MLCRKDGLWAVIAQNLLLTQQISDAFRIELQSDVVR